MPQYMDIAVNLIGSSLEKDIQRVIEDATNQSVTSMVVIGSHLDESGGNISNSWLS